MNKALPFKKSAIKVLSHIHKTLFSPSLLLMQTYSRQKCLLLTVVRNYDRPGGVVKGQSGTGTYARTKRSPYRSDLFDTWGIWECLEACVLLAVPNRTLLIILQ